MDNLEIIDNNEALVLLKNCFAIPKFPYILRTSLAYNGADLRRFDDTLRKALSRITDVAMGDESWLQETRMVDWR